MSVFWLLVLMAADGGAAPENRPEAGQRESAISRPASEKMAVAVPAIGDGFAKDSRSVEVRLSRAFGTTDMGSKTSHDLWVAQVQGGWMLTDVMEPDYWFGGNLEAMGQILAGRQDHPDKAYFIGLNAGLRYHFRTGTRVDPYLAGFFGLAATDIGSPDLSGAFQFNESIGAGARYFLTRNYAVTVDYALWHVSNGGRRDPNSGVTAHMVSLGFGWIF